jgi:hypothetical protein
MMGQSFVGVKYLEGMALVAKQKAWGWRYGQDQAGLGTGGQRCMHGIHLL